MANCPWKLEDCRTAAVFGGSRFNANADGPLNFETAEVVGQVTHVRHLSLAALEALAVEMEQIGKTKAPPKLGVVLVHRRPGRGHVTPRRVVLLSLGLHHLSPYLTLHPHPSPSSAIVAAPSITGPIARSIARLHLTTEYRLIGPLKLEQRGIDWWEIAPDRKLRSATQAPHPYFPFDLLTLPRVGEDATLRSPLSALRSPPSAM